MLRLVSIFSGCGGLDLGFQREGFALDWACDNDAAAVDVYRRNVDAKIDLVDVTTEDFRARVDAIPSCDVLLGGFPCQGFSKAGPKRLEDPRNFLYEQMVWAVSRLRPRIFIAENVDGLRQNFQGAALKQIIRDFGALGYNVEHRVLDAAEYGVPQHRRRVFIVGVDSAETETSFEWPRPTHAAKARNGESALSALPLLEGASELLPPLTIRDAIEDLTCVPTDGSSDLDHRVTGAWPDRYGGLFAAIREGQKLCNVRFAPTSVFTWQVPAVFGAVSERETTILETIARNRRHRKYGSKPNGNPLSPEVIATLSGLDDIEQDLQRLVEASYLKELDGKFDVAGATFCSGLFKRPRMDETAPTVLTNFHNPRYFLHPTQDRPFSLRECARLQGFPDDFGFTSGRSRRELVDGYRLVGNAVPPPLGQAFARAVRLALSGSEARNAFAVG